MPCNHKFKKDLNLDRLDFEPETLIVGTFCPEWPDANTAQWFYGRILDAKGNRSNSFWDVLPRIYNEPGLLHANPVDWKLFCKKHRIALTDLISAVDDADAGNKEHNKILASMSDDALEYNFDDFEYVDIVRLLQNNPGIKNVYLTRGVTDSFWRHLWNPVMQYCNRNQLHDRILLTPAGANLYQHEAHNADNPDDVILLVEDYILRRWQKEWHF